MRVWTNGTSWYDPKARLQALQQLYETSPGRAAGGSGSTGLLSSDRRGWDAMLQEQQEYAALQHIPQKQLGGSGDVALSALKLPVSGGDVMGARPGQSRALPQNSAPLEGDAARNATMMRGASNVNMGQGYETHDHFMQRSDPSRKQPSPLSGLKGLR